MFDAIQNAAGAAAHFAPHFSHPAQDTRLLRLTTPLGPDKLVVERIDGHEGLSEGFCFDIVALSADDRIDLDTLLGQPALLQILTQHSRSALRPVHGHVTVVERLGADGGLARYRIRLEPWLALLRHRYDSYVWQDKSVLDIVQEIFSDYRGKGRLAPRWRLALADATPYRPRALCTQYEESDLAFVERLLAEEGLFYWFEHHSDAAGDGFGHHTLVIADHNGAFVPNAQNPIRFHRAAAVEKSDSITEWHAQRRLATNTVALASWKPAEAGAIGAELRGAHNNGNAPALTSSDYPGEHRFGSQAEAQRCARIQLEALEARNKTYGGESTVRTLAPGTTFVLTGHALHAADRLSGGDAGATFAVIRVAHRARNNLTSAARTLADGLFANSMGDGKIEQDEPLYSNRFTALRADVPWRPLSADGHDALSHPKPAVSGIQTAIVVGLPGQEISTERDHRIKVQMHWQRGLRSQSRRAHPQDDDNAPGNEASYIWVRVAESAAGANWGASFIPRIGQEVIVDFIEGDIDRPIVTGSLYNGRGAPDAQGNLAAQGAGPAVGNAPAWFAGANGDHAHNAVLSGFKTQEIGHSQDGQGGYNALVFDDSVGQVGLRLHTTQHDTQLNLGHIKRQRDNERRQSHGHGAELTTTAYGALRAGQGLLICADARPEAGSAQMDASEAREQLRQAHELHKGLAGSAQQHHAFAGPAFDKERHGLPEKVLARPLDALAQNSAGAGAAAGGGAGTAPAFGRPDLVLSAPSGIALLTPDDMHATASAVTIAGGADVGATAGRNLVLAVKDGISLFTCGDAKARRKEQGDKGIRLHAAQGKVDVQAQSGALNAAADKDVEISSTHRKVEAAAKEHVLLAAGGAYVKLAGGNIEIHAPGSVQFKAAMKELDGPASMTSELPILPRPAFMPTMEELHGYSVQFSLLSEQGKPMENWPYIMESKQGHFIEGITDKDGKTQRIYTTEPVIFTIRKNSKMADMDKFTPARTERFDNESEK